MQWNDPRLPTSFWQRAVDTGEHWLWNGELWGNGYGRLKFQRKTWRIHRLIYTMTYGEPKNNVLHHCDIRNCFKPECLYDGTHADNMRDRRERNRIAPGKKKLSTAQVDEIKHKYATGGFIQIQLAKMYDVSQKTISNIVRDYTTTGHPLKGRQLTDDWRAKLRAAKARKTTSQSSN